MYSKIETENAYSDSEATNSKPTRFKPSDAYFLDVMGYARYVRRNLTVRVVSLILGAFLISVYVGYQFSQDVSDMIYGVEVKISFGRNLQMMDYAMSNPLVNIPWTHVTEENVDEFSATKVKK